MTSTPVRRRAATGTVAGYVLRLCRESVPRTQSSMAEALGIDLTTMQGWESGRRPLANMPAGRLLDLRRRLPTLGAAPRIVAMMEPAMDADRIIGAALAPTDSALHPLAGWVHTRDTAHMIAWVTNGTAPPALLGHGARARRGPVASTPQLAASDRKRFFTHLRDVTEAADRHVGKAPLLHRQALYLASYDKGPETASWTTQALHGTRGILAPRGWTPQWTQVRSTATALARLGDPEPLLEFIDRSVADDDQGEAANLNYWAYWLGAVAQPQADDLFMRDPQQPLWDPVTLLRCLSQSLHPAPGYVDLYAHSLWALLNRHPWLPQASAVLAAELETQIEQLLDGGRISPRSRRELSAVHYVLRPEN
ncbi:XRE family transcriptional regulator [Streptomyces sp. NPDC051561]|uniref:XRE family transcriptional regulator n=1 Tax=Streptomyces sp. NPDC051561 TaxID=3365658 RepID=UPI00379522DA